MDAVKRLKNQLLSKKAKMVSGKSRLYGQVSVKKYMQLYANRNPIRSIPEWSQAPANLTKLREGQHAIMRSGCRKHGSQIEDVVY